MWQPIFMISGYFMSILGLSMLIPAAVDMYYTHQNWSPFVTSSIISLFIGVSLYLGNRTKIDKISIRQGYLITAVSWLALSLLSALPFMLTGTTSSWVDAVFEATSGITTTGATILTDIEKSSKAVLLWRSLLNALGGVGIVIFAVALLPFLGIGGMQIFQRESSDLNEKLMPKISYIAKRIILIYILLLALTFGGLLLAGMGKFDALNHALASVSTGGFSTKNASIGYFNNIWVELVLMLAMIAGSLPLTWYLAVLKTGQNNSFRSAQVPFFLKTLLLFSVITTLWLAYTNEQYSFWQALRYASFNVVSITTDTGFASTDYMKWGLFAQTVFLIFAVTGGCSGSTSGGVKAFRWQVIFAFFKKSIINMTEPSRILPVKIKNMNVDDKVINSVFIFILAFGFSIIGLTTLVAITGVDFTTALSAVIGCITNAGPGVGNIVGPSGTFAPLSDFAKYVCAFAMLLGRLEVMTILVVLTKNFWRK